MWQDIVVSLLQLGFGPALWPIIVNKTSQVPRKSSVPTALLLATMGVVMATAGWWWAAASTMSVASTWAFIAWRRATPTKPKVKCEPCGDTRLRIVAGTNAEECIYCAPR